MLLKMQNQISLTLHWLTFPEWGKERISHHLEFKGSQYVTKQQTRIIANILQLEVGYLNAIIYRKPEKQNWKLKQTGVAQPGKTCGLMSPGLGLDCEDTASRVLE